MKMLYCSNQYSQVFPILVVCFSVLMDVLTAQHIGYRPPFKGVMLVIPSQQDGVFDIKSKCQSNIMGVYIGVTPIIIIVSTCRCMRR